jgi:hypothetical protein
MLELQIKSKNFVSGGFVLLGKKEGELAKTRGYLFIISDGEHM